MIERNRRLRLQIRIVLAAATVVFTAYSYAALAQTPPANTATNELETVVVTGSFIRGNAEQTALPVDVVSAEDLENQGSPTLVQLVKNLPATSGGSVGESNRFLGGSAGSASINLRGFGALRTLVLFNNQRMATSPNGTFGAVDINLIPTAAIGSIEVLKDGAAATYGSDAVAGVVNFRTRRDLNGFEANAHYSHIQESNGDYDASVAWGNKFSGGNVLVTAGYRRRSQLKTVDVDWAVLRGASGFATDPFGGWSGASNPGTYTAGTAAQKTAGTYATNFLDDGCTEMGGILSSATGCRFQYSNFDNLVNDEKHWQLYGEGNFTFGDSLKLHAELLWGHHEVPNERVSPAQSTVQFPSPIPASGGSPGGGTSPYPAVGLNQQSRYFIPANNPGLAAYIATHCTTPTGTFTTLCPMLPNGVITAQTGWRPEGYGGNPLFADGADEQKRKADGYRASVALSGSAGEVADWDATLTWMDNKTHQETPDIIVNRLQLALMGLGGPNCNPLTGTAGVGPCMWFNPFSNGVAASAVTGAANQYYLGNSNPALVNNHAVLDWMHQYITDDGLSRLVVADVVFNGKTPWHLAGGNVAWALGAQGRYEQLKRDTPDISNVDISPCVDDADDHNPACTGGSGVYTFYAGIGEYNVSRKVYAGFGELDVPILESDMPMLKSIDSTLALRYESYGGGIGSTTNPKVAMKWQFFDWIALRGSWGSTFRAPSPVTVTSGRTRALAQFTDPTTGTSLYRPVDTYNNPNLVPETAKTFNVGLIFKAGGFSGSVDYYNFRFKDELTTETGADIFRTMFPSATASTWQCANAALAARFTFATGGCSPSNFLGVRTNQINGPGVDTSGIDFEARYLWSHVFGGQLEVGIDGNHMFEYARGAVTTLEGITVAAATDRAGTLELLSNFFAYPKWRGNAHVNYALDIHNFRVDYHVIGQMYDRNHVLATTPSTVWAPVSGYHQFDLTYLINLKDVVTLTAAVQNVTDQKPSFAYSQYNYDYTAANPLGRVFELGVKVKF